MTDEAYKRLRNLKHEGESFSKVINRLTGKFQLLDLVGILSSEQANEMRDSIRDMSERGRQGLDRKMSLLSD